MSLQVGNDVVTLHGERCTRHGATSASSLTRIWQCNRSLVSAFIISLAYSGFDERNNHSHLWLQTGLLQCNTESVCPSTPLRYCGQSDCMYIAYCFALRRDSTLRDSGGIRCQITYLLVNLIVDWKPHCIDFFDSFRNKSGKPHPIRTKVGTHAQVKGRQRSRNFGRDRLSGGEMRG